MAKKPVKKSAAKAKKPAKPAHKPVAKAHAKKAAPKVAPKKAAAHKPAKKAATGKAAKPVKPGKVAKPAAHPVAKKAVAHPAPKPVAKKGHEKEKPAKKAAPKEAHPHPAPEKPAKKKAKVEPIEAVEEELEASEELSDGESEEVVLTDAEGRRYCRVKDCDQLSTVEGYCRYHYLLFWKKIQVRKKILTEGKLERYIEELTARYPDKFLDMLRKDLRSDKEFLAAIAELEIDESASEGEFEDEAQTYIDEVRGMAEAPSRDDEDF